MSVRFLVDKGANIEEVDENGNTPLATAILNGRTNAAIYFVEKGLSTRLVVLKIAGGDFNRPMNPVVNNLNYQQRIQQKKQNKKNQSKESRYKYQVFSLILWESQLKQPRGRQPARKRKNQRNQPSSVFSYNYGDDVVADEEVNFIEISHIEPL